METRRQAEQLAHIMDLAHQAIREGSLERAGQLIATLHPSELADLLEGLPGKLRKIAWGLVDPSQEGDVLSYMKDAARIALLEQMQPHEVVNVTQDLDTDDAADILQDLPDDVANTVLSSMDEQNRQRLSSILSYPEDRAGGLMNIDVIPVRADVTLDVVSRYLKKMGALPSKTDNLMVVDRNNRYLGVLPLEKVLICAPETMVGEVMTEMISINANLPNREVTKLFEQRDLVSAAVVNDAEHLLGRITIDDVVDVIQEDAEYAMRRMACLGDDDMFAPVTTSAKRRAVWLGINLITALLATWVIDRFEEAIQQLVTLAVLMPIVAGMGGIAGSQTLTIATRGIALGRLTIKNAKPLIIKEILVGMLNGICWSTVICLIVVLWFAAPTLGVIIAIAMFINLFVASVAGTMIPVILKYYGIDPAIAGGVILTTITDITGFASFLGLATWFLLS